MKVAILGEGLAYRLAEEDRCRPGPMVEIDGKTTLAGLILSFA